MELYSLMMAAAVFLFKPNTLQCFVCPKRIWPEVLYAFRTRFFVPTAVQTINFPFLEPPLLVDGLGDSRGESCPADASAKRSDRKA